MQLNLVALLASALLTTVTSALPTPSNLEERQTLTQSLSSTRNDLSGGCKPVSIIFARGTAEPGNVGLLAGPPFFNSLGAIIGFDNIAVQGVDYPADIPGYLVGGSASGSKTLAGLVSTAASQCPSTQIVVGGYR